MSGTGFTPFTAAELGLLDGSPWVEKFNEATARFIEAAREHDGATMRAVFAVYRELYEQIDAARSAASTRAGEVAVGVRHEVHEGVLLGRLYHVSFPASIKTVDDLEKFLALAGEEIIARPSRPEDDRVLFTWNGRLMAMHVRQG